MEFAEVLHFKILWSISKPNGADFRQCLNMALAAFYIPDETIKIAQFHNTQMNLHFF
jgi:hypothetical protein